MSVRIYGEDVAEGVRELTSFRQMDEITAALKPKRLATMFGRA